LRLWQDALQPTGFAIKFSPVREVVFRHAVLLELNGDQQASRKIMALAMKAYPESVQQFRKEFAELGLQKK